MLPEKREVIAERSLHTQKLNQNFSSEGKDGKELLEVLLGLYLHMVSGGSVKMGQSGRKSSQDVLGDRLPRDDLAA